MIHTLRLDNYSPTPRKLVLGTNSSFGTESIKIERGAGWDGLNLTATWHIPGREEPLRVALLDGDAMDVPPEVTKEAKDGVLVLAGLAPGVQRASCNVEYLIIEQAGVYGGADAEPTPELAEQVLEAALQAKADAEAAAQDASEAKANANKAQQAAENAAADAAKAGPYAEAALAAQEAAEEASDDAQAAARAAKASEAVANESKNAAAASENNARISAGAAAVSEGNAAGSKAAAASSATAAADNAKTASDAAAVATDAKAAAVAAQKDAAASKAAAANSAAAAKTSEDAAAKSAADADSTANSIKDSMTQIAANKEAVSQLKEEIGNFKNDVNENMSFFNEFNDFNESVGLVRVNAGTAYIDSSFNRYKTITINAVSGQEFELIGSVNGAINYLVVTTDASDKVIEKYNPGVNGIVSQKTQVIAVDDNIKKIYFCFWSDSGRAVRKRALVNIEDFENQIKSYTDTKYTEAITYADNAIVKDTKNKNIVFFGTSIPAGTVKIEAVEQSIPSYMGELLHATVINESVGSSMARLGWNSSKTENDPYGWTGRAWQNVFRAMGATLEEKRDLIENYETKWRDLIGGDFEGSSGDGSGTGKPMTLTSKMESDILSWSYENKLIPYLDGTKTMPDLFIFEHGHNDYAPDMSGIPSANPDDINGYNRSLYSDVMAFYFRLIWEANPQARILIVSHYANDTEKSKRIFDAQKKCAEHNKVWFCDIANNVGWSQQKVTVNGVPKTRLEQCLPDALHPSTDTSGNAVKRESKIITNYIKAFIF